MKNRNFFYGVMVWAGMVAAGMFPSGLRAQSCYVQLDDASGFNTASYLPGLEEAAQKIWDVFPDAAYRDSFKVFSFGFYKDLKTYDAYTYPDAFEEVRKNLADKQSPYYLLIGRQTDHTGVYTGFFVAAKLPDGGQFPCLTAEKTQAAKNMVEHAIKTTYSARGGAPFVFAAAETAGMEKLHFLLDKSINCCQSNLAGQKSSTCEMPESAIEDLLLGDGYFNYNGLDITLNQREYPEIPSEWDIQIKLDDRCPFSVAGIAQDFNLTDELVAFLADFRAEGGTDKVEVFYYNEINSFDFLEDQYGGSGSAAKSSYDYTEKIIILNFSDSEPKVYFTFSYGSGGSSAAKSSLWPGFNSFIKWFFKRASTNPTTVLIGMVLDYVVNATVEYWFNAGEHETWLGALGEVISQRGVTGAGVVLLENVVNVPAMTALTTFAMHFIDKDPEDWDVNQALVSALTTTVFQSFLSPAVLKKFSKLSHLIVDFGKEGGQVLFRKMLSNRQVVTVWQDLREVFGESLNISCLK